MSNSQYWTILTRAGREKVLAAIANKHTVKISEFAVGDGQITHTSDDLSNSRYRSHTSSLKQLTNNNALIEVVGIVPASEGGFYVREAAFYTDDGQAFAIINYPETYKPAAADNAAAELGIKAVIDVVNAQVISEKIDPSMIYATKEWVSDQVDQSELSVLTQVGKNWNFDNGTSTTVNINADDTGLAVLNVCSGTSDAQTTGRVYVGQSLRHGGGIEYNGNNNPVTTGAGADYVTLFRRSQGQLHWTAKNLHSNNDWEFRGAVKSPNFIEGGTSLKDKYQDKHDKLQQLTSSGFHFTPNDLKIHNKRALVGHTHDGQSNLHVNYGNDFENVFATGKWSFNHPIKIKGGSLDYKSGGYGNTFKLNTENGYLFIGPQNNIHCHYETDRTNHWFNTQVQVNGEIYAGSGHNKRVFHQGFLPTTGELGVYSKVESDSNYLGKTEKAVDSAKLEGKTKAEVISEARNGLAQVNTSPTFKNATFDNGTSTTVNINADSNGMATLNVSSDDYANGQTAGRVYVGQSLRCGGGIEYNGDNAPLTTGAGADYFAFFRNDHGDYQWTARNYFLNNNWEFRGAVKSPNFIEGGTSLKDKYQDKHDKLQQLTSSGFHFTPNDLKIHNKRALVGHTHDGQSNLHVNYGNDFENVFATGKWSFNHPIKIKGGSLDYTALNQSAAFKLNTEKGYLFVGPQNNNYCHYETDRPRHWFNKPIQVSGEIYAGHGSDKRVFHQGFLPTTGELGVYSKAESDSKYLGKTAKAADSAKLEGKTKAQVVSEARANLVVYKSTPTHGRNFLSDAAWVVSCANGSVTNIDHLWYTDSNADGFAGAYHACADSTFKAQGNAAFYAGGFFENGTKLSDKYHQKSDKLARFENSLIDTNGGQDLLIRNKRALVGSEGRLVINYGSDWPFVTANGKWQFADSINTNGDITVTKNNPWLTLDSASTGNAHNEQAAGISLGEGGRHNSASLHLSYTGGGHSYIGMGGLGSDNIANNWAMKMQYQSTWVQFRSAVLLGNGNTQLSKGSDNSLRIKTNHGYVDIGPQNSHHCHYVTSLSNHWFNKDVRVNGEIYAGPDYNRRVLHEGNISSYAEKRTVKASGTLTASSKNHLTATKTFTLPSVTNLAEGTTVVTSKAMAVTPTIKTHGAEHIAMMRGTTMITDTSVLFDRHCTLTFILNSEKNWEMQ